MPVPGAFRKIVSGPTKEGVTVTADSSLRFAPESVPVKGETVRDIILTLSGDATAILTNVLRFVLKGGNVPFIDSPITHVRAWLGWIGKKADLVATNAYASIPLHGYRGWSAPPGVSLTIEVAKNATMKTPTIALHQGINEDEVSNGYMYLLSQTFGVPASASRFPIPISQPGMLVGLILPGTANITLLRGYDASGMFAEFTASDALIASEYSYQGTTVVDPLYWKVPVERMIVSGVTRLELGVNSSWTDAEIGFHSFMPSPAYLKALEAAAAA